MGATILVIEDEQDIRRLLRVLLEGQNHAVIEAANARDGVQAIVAKRPDVIILDLGLPDRDGQEVIRQIREWSATPIIVLSARDEEDEKVTALECGADDYLTKPFSAPELAARIKVSLRHSARLDGARESTFELDGLNVDFAARSVSLSGEPVRLTPIEYKLLTTLVRHAGKVLTHRQLMKEIWGRHAADNNQGLRIHVQHLREKLRDDPLSPRFIMTEPGIGYRFRSP